MEPSYRLGQPAYLSIPDGRRGSYGDLVGEVAEMMHRPLDPHQLLAVDAINSYGRGGRWLALESCVVGPRQVTGKTGGIVLPSLIANVLTWSEPDVAVWSAHRMKTTMLTVKDLQKIIEGSEEFSKRVRKFSVKDDDAELSLINGSSVMFVTRSEGNARGMSGGDVVDDEALYMTESLAGDLMPIMASRPNPRVMHASSAAKAKSVYLQKLMARGRAGDSGLVYVEFRAPGSWEDPGCTEPGCTHDAVPGCALDDLDVGLFAAPSVVHGRVGREVLVMLRGAMSPREYAREMYGWEESGASDVNGIPAAGWAACRDVGSEPDGLVAFGLDVTLDRSAAVIGCAGRTADGTPYVEVVEQAAGTGWVAERLAGIVARHGGSVVVDGSSPARSLVAELENAGINVVQPQAVEIAGACGQLFDAIVSGSLRHRGRPVLDDAVAAAVRKQVGDGAFRWSRRSSGADITPLYAVTLAWIDRQAADVSGPSIW